MRHVGVWVDHQRAVLVELAADGSPSTRTVLSGVERRLKSQGGAHGSIRSHRIGGVSHRHLAERRRNALRRFHQRVADTLAEADDVVILGPGLARKELAEALRSRSGHVPRIRAVLASGELSRAELCAHVRELFGLPPERLGPRHAPRKLPTKRAGLVRTPRPAG